MANRPDNFPNSLAPSDVAVIIPHHNDVLRLGRCLDALCADPESRDAEIVVVDNGSTEQLDAATSRHPNVRVIVEAHKGAANARNRGVAETTAPALFFLDADCVPEIGWLAAGCIALEGTDIVGGKVTLFDETPPPRNGAQAFETVFAFDQQKYIEKMGFSVSANLLTWRSVFDKVGGFVNGVSEDVDWCHRATAAGMQLIYAPEVAVGHPTRSDFESLLRKWRRLETEMFALTSRRPLPRLRRLWRATAILISPLIHLPRIIVSPHLCGMMERMRATGVLVRLRLIRAAWAFRQAFGLSP